MKSGMKKGAQLRVLRTGVSELDLLFAVVRQARLDIHFNAKMKAQDVPPTEFLSEFLDGALDSQSAVIVPQRKAPARHRGRWHAYP